MGRGVAASYWFCTRERRIDTSPSHLHLPVSGGKALPPLATMALAGSPQHAEMSSALTHKE